MKTFCLLFAAFTLIHSPLHASAQADQVRGNLVLVDRTIQLSLSECLSTLSVPTDGSGSYRCEGKKAPNHSDFDHYYSGTQGENLKSGDSEAMIIITASQFSILTYFKSPSLTLDEAKQQITTLFQKLALDKKAYTFQIMTLASDHHG